MTQVTIEQAMRLALQHHQAGRIAEAEKIYRQVLTQKPNHADALHLLGVIAHQTGDLDTGIKLIQQAITINPTIADYHNNFATVLRDKGLRNESITALREAVRLKPDYADAFYNLAVALREKGSLDEAIGSFRQSIRLKPDFVEAYNNLGNALRHAKLLDEAIAAYRQAVLLKPDLPEAHHNLAIADLLNGDFAEGWREYEWRWQCKNFISPRREFILPLWDGSELKGKTILLHAEQGFGDTIQFVRYAPIVANRGGKVVLQCQTPLLRLLQGFPGTEQVIAMNQPVPHFDTHCPLLSLPMVFNTRLETIPATIPYLQANADLSHQWSAYTGGTDGLKVGIAWAGASGHANDRNRSLPLHVLGPLAKITGIRFFSLQKGEAAKQALAPQPGMELIDRTAEINDFADTAALIANLNLVIAADTAVAHLAGAMGKPTWLLLPYAPDWRWLMNRDDTPWYPTMRLFRQKNLEDWPEVIERVRQALGEFRPTSPPR